MTIQESEHILEVVLSALQDDDSPRFHPISSLRGYDVFRIDKAIKLQIANDFLILSYKDDFEEQFASQVQLYSSLPLHIVTGFVADTELAKLQTLEPDSLEFKQFVMEISPRPLDPSTGTFKDERLASLETPSSFGDYCRSVGVNDPIFWQKIYTRIDLDYNSSSPKGNKPVFLSDYRI